MEWRCYVLPIVSCHGPAIASSSHSLFRPIVSAGTNAVGGTAMTEHGHGHGHIEYGPVRRGWAAVAHAFAPHSHDAADRVDQALETSRSGMRALWVSLLVLGATAAFQAVVVVLSGSVALLSDTLHNVAAAL